MKLVFHKLFVFYFSGDSNPVAKYSNSSKSAVRAQTGSWSWKPYTYESKQVCDSELRFIRPGVYVVNK